MNQEMREVIEQYTKDLGDLFARQVTDNPKSDFERGRNDAFDLAASACYKAGTRKIVISPGLDDVQIKISVPHNI